MSGEFSREAIASQLGEKVTVMAERLAMAPADVSPEVVERVRRLIAPTVRRLAELDRQADMADAA